MMIEEMINKYTGEADYYDMHTGYTYHIQNWARAYKFFGMNLPMEVSENGKVIGTVSIDLSLVHI
jgi:hypothetical protein